MKATIEQIAARELEQFGVVSKSTTQQLIAETMTLRSELKDERAHSKRLSDDASWANFKPGDMK